jgi:hypothetical protein
MNELWIFLNVERKEKTEREKNFYINIKSIKKRRMLCLCVTGPCVNFELIFGNKIEN